MNMITINSPSISAPNADRRSALSAMCPQTVPWRVSGCNESDGMHGVVTIHWTPAGADGGAVAAPLRRSVRWRLDAAQGGSGNGSNGDVGRAAGGLQPARKRSTSAY
jgi:hypothetical protein